jgi:hypothetical protein
MKRGGRVLSGLALAATLLFGTAGPARADTVTDWNSTLIAGLAAAKLPPPSSARVSAIVQAAVFDAVDGIEHRYAPYHLRLTAPRGASPDAAAASAAYTTLAALIPSQGPLFAQGLQATLAGISDASGIPGPSVAKGLAWGRTVAMVILAWRAADGHRTALSPYVVDASVGDWQPTAPTPGPPLYRQFADMAPFALTSPTQFRPQGPPSLTSRQYARDLAEVEALGGAHSALRTPEQTRTALFWQSDSPVAIWNRVADQLAVARPTTLIQNAHLLAVLNIALADATIAIWNAKATYNFWRPVTAIADTAHPEWSSLQAAPLVQEYPSADAGLGSAAATVLASFFGRYRPFIVTTAGPPLTERHFRSFSSAVTEVENAEIDAGIQFRFSCVDGAALGARVASYVIRTVGAPFR